MSLSLRGFCCGVLVGGFIVLYSSDLGLVLGICCLLFVCGLFNAVAFTCVC